MFFWHTKSEVLPGADECKQCLSMLSRVAAVDLAVVVGCNYNPLRYPSHNQLFALSMHEKEKDWRFPRHQWNAREVLIHY